MDKMRIENAVLDFETQIILQSILSQCKNSSDILRQDTRTERIVIEERMEMELENGTRRAQIPRKPLIFPSPNKRTNKQTNRQTKNFGHTEFRTLDPRVFSTMLLPTEV